MWVDVDTNAMIPTNPQTLGLCSWCWCWCSFRMFPICRYGSWQWDGIYMAGRGSRIYWICSPVKLFTSSKWTDISIGIRQLTSSSDFYWLSGISVEQINNRRNPSSKQIFTVRNIWGIISEYFDKYYFGWPGRSSGWLLLISKSAFPCLPAWANRVMSPGPDIDFLFSMSEIARPRQPNYLKKQKGSQLISTFYSLMNI